MEKLKKHIATKYLRFGSFPRSNNTFSRETSGSLLQKLIARIGSRSIEEAINQNVLYQEMKGNLFPLWPILGATGALKLILAVSVMF